MTRWLVAIPVAAILSGLLAGAPQKGGPARFDYYLLSLSWSPEHCAETHDTSSQCTGPKPFGFVVHGLWPNASSGPNPMNCDGPAYNPRLTPKDLMEIMPSQSLMRHEWSTHGTCSGMGQAEYFQLVEKAWSLVVIPPDVKNPDHQVSISPLDLKKHFAAANPSLPADGITIDDNGSYLREVRVCLTKDLTGTHCSSRGDVRPNATITLRPAR